MPNAPNSPTAEDRSLPQVVFYSVEYPGCVQESSIPLVIRKMGGQLKLDNAFRRSGQKKNVLLELSFRSNDPFAHPIPGDVVPANNLLLKVVKRKRKSCSSASSSKDSAIGEFTANIVGVISKTARFRSEFSLPLGLPASLKLSQAWPTISIFRT